MTSTGKIEIGKKNKLLMSTKNHLHVLICAKRKGDATKCLNHDYDDGATKCSKLNEIIRATMCLLKGPTKCSK